MIMKENTPIFFTCIVISLSEVAESLELVTSRKTFPYKNYNLKPVNFDGFTNYYRLDASENCDNKIIFYLFLFIFFSMKNKTRTLCLITVSLLTKPL